MGFVALLDGALFGAAVGVMQPGGAGINTARQRTAAVQPESGPAQPGAARVQPGAGPSRPGAARVQPGAGPAQPGAATVQQEAGTAAGSAQTQPEAAHSPWRAQAGMAHPGGGQPGGVLSGDRQEDAKTTGNSDEDTVQARTEKLIALTFDDGPHKTCTPKLLDGLKERGVHATFFLMGENIAGNEGLVRRMQEEGHLIGNHSYRHIQLTKAGEDAVCQAVEQTEEIIGDITGSRPQYLRPPYGDWNESLECRMNLTTVFWSVDSLDWKLKNTPGIVRRVEKDVKEGDIILMHDIFPTSVDAALQLIDRLQEKGYRFVTVDEMLID